MKKRMLAGAALVAAFALGSLDQTHGAVTNTFTPSCNDWVLVPSTNGWIPDRYPANSFIVTNVQGRLALALNIDPADSLDNRPPAYQSTFYNTQGFQMPAGLGTNGWSASASLLITPDMTNDPTLPYRSDFWLRTGPIDDESLAQYFIIGVFIGDTNDRANPAPDPANITQNWEVWDDVNGVWNLLTNAVTNGWTDTRIAIDSQGAVEYYLGTNLVYTQTDIAFPDQMQPSTVFLEAYNFGGNAYSAIWGGDWIIDRFPPNSVTETDLDGMTGITLGVDPSGFQGTGSFYNTEGFQIPAAVNTNNHWRAHASLYVPTGVANGSIAPERTDLWARTGPTDESLADYFIIGLFDGDTNNRVNPAPGTVAVAWEVWDDVNGVWIYLSTPVTPGWHALDISYDNGTVYYYIDKQLAYTDTNIGNPTYADELSTVFIEAYNFGGQPYGVTWSTVQDTDASTPFLPATMAITTVIVTAQPGFDYDNFALTNIAANEVWTPVASAMNVTGQLKYRLPTPPPGSSQFFRSVSKP